LVYDFLRGLVPVRRQLLLDYFSSSDVVAFVPLATNWSLLSFLRVLSLYISNVLIKEVIWEWLLVLSLARVTVLDTSRLPDLAITVLLHSVELSVVF